MILRGTQALGQAAEPSLRAAQSDGANNAGAGWDESASTIPTALSQTS
jgi:hypothetical protein